MNNFEDWYNNQAIEIWNEYGSNQELVPLLIPKTETNIDVLYVGMNPSHRKDWIQKKIKKYQAEFNDYTVDTLYIWDQKTIHQKVPFLKLIELKARMEDTQYYGALEKFTKECGLSSWTHIDLFLIRETKQNELLKKIEYNEQENYINEFGKKQVTLFNDALEKISPKIIVINNATTSVYLSKFLGKSLDIQTKINYKNTIIFFGGMLSGQRTMDRFSRLRLINEIKQLLL